MGHRIPGTKITWTYCHGLPAFLGVIAFFAVVFAMWMLLFRSEVVNYGDPKSVYFEPNVATEGDTVSLHFDDVVWKRLCPSRLVTYLTPAKGSRLDLETYIINVPYTIDEVQPDGTVVKVKTPLPHRVPPKFRKWIVPELGKNQSPGLAVVSGHIESECSPLDHWRPIITPMPSAKITINKR